VGDGPSPRLGRPRKDVAVDRIDLGGGHSFEWIAGDADSFPELFPERTYESDGKRLVLVGIIEYHLRPDGEECGGGVNFSRPLSPSRYEAERPVWTVEALDPLTLSPSVLCAPENGGCGAHGFIRAGRWEGA